MQPNIFRSFAVVLVAGTTEVRTYLDCTIPDWAEDGVSFYGHNLEGRSLERTAGETVNHGDAIKAVCADNGTATKDGSSEHEENIFFCSNGAWKPELFPCIAEEDLQLNELAYFIGENETGNETDNFVLYDANNTTTLPTTTPLYHYEDFNPQFDSIYSDSDDDDADSSQKKYHETKGVEHNAREPKENEEEMTEPYEVSEDITRSGSDSKEDSKTQKTKSTDTDSDESSKTKTETSEDTESDDNSSKTKTKTSKDSDNDNDSDDEDSAISMVAAKRGKKGRKRFRDSDKSEDIDSSDSDSNDDSDSGCGWFC